MEQTHSQIQRERDELLRRLQESDKRASEMEGKIALLSQEIERLNGALKGKMDEVRQYEAISHNQAQEIESLKKRYTDL